MFIPMKKLLFLLLVIFCTGAAFCQQEQLIPIGSGWKFIPEDKPVFAQSDFNDSSWKPILTDQAWEGQGYEGHDGYAWYRIRVVIPSSLKASAFLKDSLRICLGKIDDYDQTWLNGVLIGTNGRNLPSGSNPDPAFMKESPIPWNLERRYTLAATNPAILWDHENVIAVRVYDQGGPGGIYSGQQEICMTLISDYFAFGTRNFPFEFTKSGLSKNIIAVNNSQTLTIKGKLVAIAKGKVSGRILFRLDTMISLAPHEKFTRPYLLKYTDESIAVSYLFRFQESPGIAVEQDETPYLLTPPEKDTPRINGALVYGARPGHPFLYKVAATGKGTLSYTADELPPGLVINPRTGIISGSVSVSGEYKVNLVVSNSLGKDQKTLLIRIGQDLALTPPMGWNSWNCWGLSVDSRKVIASAHAFTGSGLQNHGWSFINIDDGWEIPQNREPKRDPSGNILTNEKFPDMKALGDTLHKMGLKFGIYSSPGPLTCGQHTGSYQHEADDARSYASWGIDYLKYDWCSYEGIAKDTTLPERKKPYLIMHEALQGVNRDIVFSLCQYGMSNVWEWGIAVGGNLWRTTGDINDSWESMSSIGFSQVQNAPYAGPGHWNDPDMLVLGQVGWGPSLHPTRLTPDEQYTHISLWSLLSAPLLIGCDLSQLDPFTMNLLTNDEVLAIDQDPLGKQATPILKMDDIQVWMKELAGGHKAFGIFNLTENTLDYTLTPGSAGLSETTALRDVWRQKNLVKQDGNWVFRIPGHGVILVSGVE